MKNSVGNYSCISNTDDKTRSFREGRFHTAYARKSRYDRHVRSETREFLKRFRV